MSRMWVRGVSLLGGALAMLLLVVLLGPAVVLFSSTSLAELRAGAEAPQFVPALLLSVRTSLWSLCLTLVMGTPLAWWLATRSGRLTKSVALVVNLPIIMPPAVVGVALLATFGREGAVGALLEGWGWELAFSEEAVVLAQLIVSAPFYIQAATTAFRKVESELLHVARSLGATSIVAWWAIAVPIAMPGLITGASLAWARALGEFGATLLFAGNLPGVTQTLPLAIFSALEFNIRLAVVFALVLTVLGAALLYGLRGIVRLFSASMGRES